MDDALCSLCVFCRVLLRDVCWLLVLFALCSLLVVCRSFSFLRLVVYVCCVLLFVVRCLLVVCLSFVDVYALCVVCGL